MTLLSFLFLPLLTLTTAIPLTSLIPTTHPNLLPRQPSTLFCDETCATYYNCYGHFSVYNTQTGAIAGCLDPNGRWVVDRNCGVFETVPYSTTTDGTSDYDRLRTSATQGGGWCEDKPDPNYDPYLLDCGAENTVDSSTIYTCQNAQSQDALSNYEGHKVHSHRALNQPTGSEKVNVTYQPTSGAPGFQVLLFWEPTTSIG